MNYVSKVVIIHFEVVKASLPKLKKKLKLIDDDNNDIRNWCREWTSFMNPVIDD